MTRDALYAEPRELLVDFAFDEQVAAVFPDMIRRSVPGYAEVIALTGLLAERHVVSGTRCYDLGCSLGAGTLSMRRRIKARDTCIIAVDSAEAMVARCRGNVAADGPGVPVEVHCADIRDVPVENASLVALNFTLQFIPPEERLGLLRRIRQGLVPGGALLLAEKIVYADAEEQRFQEAMHLAFKRANGYSALEISQKRSALEKVLIPETLEAHQRRLAEAGFAASHVWFRCFNFVAIAALT